MSSRWRNVSRCLIFAAAAAPGVARADYVGNKYTDAATGEVLEYNVFVPTGYDPAKKYPLLVFLHAANNTNPPNRTLSSDGVGWTGSFINTPHQATDPSFFMIPISQTNMGGWGGATDPITTPEKFEGRLTIQVLQTVVMTKYNIDPNRLYITGPSMGGRGTWDIMRRYPHMFAAAAPAAAPAGVDDAPLYVNQNIWALCGEVDPIVQGERDAITAIRKAGGNPIYTELANHPHDSWRWVYTDPQFVPWIFAQRLGVPWWTVSKPPMAPFTGMAPPATLTPAWPVVVPPANLPSSFGGAAGTIGAGVGGQPVTGAGGGSGNGGTAGQPGSAASGGADAGGASGAGANPVFGSGGDAATGGFAAPISSGGATSSGGAGVPSGSGGSAIGPTSGSGGSPGRETSTSQSGGCAFAPGRGTPLSPAGSAALLGLLAFCRRRRGRPRR